MHRRDIMVSDLLSAAHAGCATRTVGTRLACVALLAAAALAVTPSVALGDACPSVDTTYTGNCGPTFAVPNWTDAGGWTDPSKYSTIQLADVNGDGRDELVGRNDQGLEIWEFDTTVGQWRPQVDANDFPQVLTDFASPVPSDESDPKAPTHPEYYSTIQAADIDGQGGEEILARFADGMRVYQYAPPAGGQDIDGGTWTRIGTAGPFSDANAFGDASIYPTIQVGKFRTEDRPLLFARRFHQPLATYRWAAGTWNQVTNVTPLGDFDINAFEDPDCAQPGCYLDLQTANVAASDPDAGDDTLEVLGRTPWGASLWDYDVFGKWGPRYAGFEGDLGALADVPGGVPIIGAARDDAGDCPFSARGATGDGSGDCLGSSPSYYETLQAANIDDKPGEELLARASDGLRVKTWVPASDVIEGHLEARPTLTDLAGAASSVAGGMWGSIRTGDIDADSKDEVLALDGTALQAWSYDPAGQAWSRLQPSTPLGLAADPWLTHPEYYATLQVGDVDGDGRDDVVARGPFGIRTWFYDRRGTGGWERYLPNGYPAFPTTGQQNAYTALNTLATNDQIIPGTAIEVRGVWSAETPPQPTDLTQLQSDLVRVAGCTGQAPANPPSYAACTPPSGSSGFTAADWTAVVNEMLAENYAAGQVVAFFTQLDGLRSDLFLNENAELPAIGQKLGLQLAAGSSATWNTPQLWSLVTGVAGALAGTVFPPLGAALSVASYALSAVPSASPTAMNTFNTTYGGLQDEFAQMATEVDKTLKDQSQAVRQDAGLLGLVGDLRARGTWDLDTTGMESAANQAFAIWVYRTLMPTIYDRYDIYACATWNPNGSSCIGPSPDEPGVIPLTDEFITIGPRVELGKVPCSSAFWTGVVTCVIATAPVDVMTRIWGPLSPQCDYVPGSSATAWTFDCSAGVDVNSSIGDNTWGFPSHEGFPVPDGNFPSSARAAARDTAQAPIMLGRPRVGHRRAVRARADLRADAFISRGVRLAGTTVSLDRLLFERSGHGELTRPRPSPPPWLLKLRRTSPGRFTAATAGRPRARLTLRRVGRRGRVAVALAINAGAFRTPRACHALPASVALKAAPLWLETHLRVRARPTRYPIRLSQQVRCRRDARGNVDRLVPVRVRRYRARPGLAVTLQGPGRVRPGTRARYVARVSNRRHRGSRRLLSSLWDITLKGSTRQLRVRELRRGRSRRLAFTVRVPRDVRGRFCGDAVATAAGARAARARTCAPVRPAGAPAVTG
jgi:hypothetical protein